jgi:hypothetical protein
MRLSLPFLWRGAWRPHLNDSVDHSIFFKGSVVLSAIFKGKNAMALLEVFDPVALVLTAVRVVKCAFAVPKPIVPVANIPISKQLVGRTGIQPDMSTKATLKVVNPTACVLFVRGNPLHGAVAVTLVVLPIAFVVVFAGVGHFALAPLHAFAPVTLVYRPILVSELSVTVTHSV